VFIFNYSNFLSCHNRLIIREFLPIGWAEWGSVHSLSWALIEQTNQKDLINARVYATRMLCVFSLFLFCSDVLLFRCNIVWYDIVLYAIYYCLVTAVFVKKDWTVYVMWQLTPFRSFVVKYGKIIIFCLTSYNG